MGPYFADFFCPEAKLVVEVDGGQHDWERAKDEERTRYIESLGFRVIRFWNNDVLGNTDGVLERIVTELAGSPKRNPRRARRGSLPGARPCGCIPGG
jgi:very-short-patch-repair endonuclease